MELLSCLVQGNQLCSFGSFTLPVVKIKQKAFASIRDLILVVDGVFTSACRSAAIGKGWERLGGGLFPRHVSCIRPVRTSQEF